MGSTVRAKYILFGHMDPEGGSAFHSCGSYILRCLKYEAYTSRGTGLRNLGSLLGFCVWIIFFWGYWTSVS